MTISQLLHEHRALSAEMALRLEKLLGASAESWLRMQEAVDLGGSPAAREVRRD